MTLTKDNNSTVPGTGFRLQYLEVLNWGTFHQKIWRIEPDGNNSLLTGDIGSGKSTLVDALTCLLVPHHKITFNKAAGAESKERSIKSYVRGEYKKTKNEQSNLAKEISLRPQANTYSVILANFNNVGYEKDICLGQVFWIRDEKPEKLFLIASKPLTVTANFSSFTDITELKKQLRAQKEIELFDDSFTKYSDRFRRLFGMNSDKAIDLFYQTVSMKAVSSLTEFVREHMLEKTDVKAKIDELRNRFDELNKAHQAVVTAREQLDILRPLNDLALQYKELSDRMEMIDRMISIIPIWFAEQKIELLEVEIQNFERELEKVEFTIKELEVDRDKFREAEIHLRQDIANNGGNRLTEIDREIKDCEKRKEVKTSKAKEYKGLVLRCGMQNAEDESSFDRNYIGAQGLVSTVKEHEHDLDLKRDDLIAEQRNVKVQVSHDIHELNSLKKRGTQIPEYMISVRSQIAKDLEIDEDAIPFVGELIKVRDDEQEWEGAIERLLHNIGLSMLVPVNLYERISRFVNSTVLQSADGKRQRLVYYKADMNEVRQKSVQVHSESVVNKLELKPDSPFENWLYSELASRFNYRCVPFEQFQQVSDAITKEGQIKSGGKRHEKDDRRRLTDRINYVLGWSNTAKVKALEDAVRKGETTLGRLDSDIRNLQLERDNNRLIEKAVHDLLKIKTFFEINWHQEVVLIESLKTEKIQLENSNDVLKALQHQLEQVINHVNNNAKELTACAGEKGAKENSLQKLKDQYDQCKSLTAQPPYLTDIDDLTKNIRERVRVELTLKNMEGTQRSLEQGLRGDDNSEHGKLAKEQGRSRDKIISRMKDMKSHSSAETSEIPADIESLPEFTAMYERVVKDDLPRHEARFKDELNKNTINSIAIFNNKLEGYQKDIQDKIEEINKHLREIEYNEGTYIKMLTDVTDDIQIRTFREDLKNCYSYSFGDADIYTQEKYEQVKKILDRFSSAQSADVDWTTRVTDVRQMLTGLRGSQMYGSGLILMRAND